MLSVELEVKEVSRFVAIIIVAIQFAKCGHDQRDVWMFKNVLKLNQCQVLT